MKRLLTILLICLGSYIHAQHLVLNELMSANSTTLLDEDGDFSDWIELYNPTNSAINIQNYSFGDNFGNLDKWKFPGVSIPSGGFLTVFLSGKNRANLGSELHTNFKLKSTGEYLILSNNQGTVVDHFLPVSLDNDHSYGRLPDGSNNAGFLTASTPQSTNNTSDFIRFIEFSHPPGFHSSSFYLNMSCSDSIYYTLDGSLPSPQSTLFETPIHAATTNTASPLSLIPSAPYNFEAPQNTMKQGIVVRAQPFRNGIPSGPVHNRTYFMQEHNYFFEVLSVVTDKANFFDQDTGIYVPGVHFDSLDPDWTGNYYQRGIDWERTCSVTLFDKGGNEAFSQDMGIRISGNGSRKLSQKSLRFYMRDEYGKSSVNYPFFPGRKNHELKRFVARSSFTSWYSNSMFKDELIQALVNLKELDLDFQMARPSILFINGEYWGIHSIKERQDEHYLHSIYGIDKDSVDIIDGNLFVDVGSSADFSDLLDFVELNDLSNPDNYAHVADQLDIDNFIDYYILQTYFGNVDWPVNNMRLWRPQTAGGKWRFLLYDLDATIGTVYQDPFERLDTLTDDQSFLFKNLLLSETFKNDFICRYQHHLITTFHPDLMKAYIFYFKQKYAPEMPKHILRWSYPTTMNEWDNACNALEDFLEERPSYIRSFLQNYFTFSDFENLSCPMGGTSGISVYPNPAEDQTYLQLNNIELIGGTVSIYDTRGTLIAEEPVEYMTQHLPIVDLRSGLYIVSVRKDDILRTTKLLLK